MTESEDDILALTVRGDTTALQPALDGGADANAADRLGVSALARAAGRGDLEAVELLLAHGAEVNRVSGAGNSALMAAAARGHLEVLERLLAAGAAPGHKNKWGLSADDWARWPDNGSEIKAVLRSRS